jgi:hypothetical protein
MFIRTLSGQEAAGRIKSLVNGTTRSVRFLSAADGMGFSYISGRGELTDLRSGQQWSLEPGTLYVVAPMTATASG